jgi:hypothetical protein
MENPVRPMKKRMLWFAHQGCSGQRYSKPSPLREARKKSVEAA